MLLFNEVSWLSVDDLNRVDLDLVHLLGEHQVFDLGILLLELHLHLLRGRYGSWMLEGVHDASSPGLALLAYNQLRHVIERLRVQLQ